MEHEAAQRAERERDRPEEHVVHEHQHFRVAAAAEHALGHDAVGRLENDDQTDGVHQLVGDILVRHGDVIPAQDQFAETENEQCGDRAERKAEPEKHPALPHGLLLVAGAERLPGHDRAGLAHALNADGAHLLRDLRDRVGRTEAELPDDDTERDVTEREQSVAHQHGDGDADVLAKKRTAREEHMPDAEPDPLVDDKQVCDDENRLENARDQRAERRALGLHAGRAEATEDQHVVRDQVDKKRSDGDEQRIHRLTDASQHDRHGQRRSEEEICYYRIPQVTHAARDDIMELRIVRADVHPDDLIREQCGNRREDDREAER